MSNDITMHGYPQGPGFGFHAKCSKQPNGVEVHYFGSGPRCQCGERTAVTETEPKPNLRLVDPPQQMEGPDAQ